MHRRHFLLGLLSAIVFAPFHALAAVWNKAAFEAVKIDEARKELAIESEIRSELIHITAPERAENGAVVQVEVKSDISGTEAIAILVDKNPTPLIANFMFSNGAAPFVITRIKMAETSDIKVVVKVGNQYFTNSRNVVVLENGCN